MTPSWYDVLDVDPAATGEEIRTAWRAAVADLDPTDRRFRQLNRAAEVLLDPDRRAAHDADLAADEEADADEGAASDVVVESAPDRVAADRGASSTTVAATSSERSPSRPAKEPATAAPRARQQASARGVVRLTMALGAAALILVVVTVVAALQVGGSSDAAAAGSDGVLPSGSASAASGALPDDSQIQDAVDAAKKAIVPVLSYDYHHLAHDEKLAKTFMTPAYADEYGQYFAAAVQNNAPRTRTVVKVIVLDSGVVRTAPGRVDVLLFVNRPTRNKQTSTVFHDQVTARMLDTGGAWKVDCLITQPNGTCGH